MSQRILLVLLSDHFPILLVGGDCVVRGHGPFCFENMWLKAKGFNFQVEEWWNSFEVRRVNSYKVAEKLKAHKSKLKRLNKDVFGRVETKKKQALQILAL